MAGGPLAQEVTCLICLDDDKRLTRAVRIYEGHESDQYRCERQHEFGLDWREPATEAQWPPPPDLAVMAKS